MDQNSATIQEISMLEEWRSLQSITSNKIVNKKVNIKVNKKVNKKVNTAWNNL